MATKDVINEYFNRLSARSGWEALLADDMTFSSFAVPSRRVDGKTAYLQATKRFYSMIGRVDVRELIVDGDRACALTHYELTPANNGPAFESDVAEIFSVKNNKIVSLAIYFDSAPFPK